MNAPYPRFVRPSRGEALIRRAYALLSGWGLDPRAPWPLLLMSILLRPAAQLAPAQNWSRHVAALFPRIDFRQLRWSDAIRFPLQILWLVLVRPARPIAASDTSTAGAFRRRWLHVARRLWDCAQRDVRGALTLPIHWTGSIVRRLRRQEDAFAHHRLWHVRAVRWFMYALGGSLAVFAITAPLDVSGQAMLSGALWIFALLIYRVAGHAVTMILIFLSVMASTRYLWWRIAYTISYDDWGGLLWGVALLAAEAYTWLVLLLAYFQTAYPLRRPAIPMPVDQSAWPSVDVMIPTYHEPLAVLRPTVIAALAMQWPADRLTVYVLDDGKREEVRRFTEEIGAKYVVREDNQHAKAGNINHALGLSSSEFIAIFDCDHIPTRSFLASVMGWFLRDKQIALVQTPHHFFSPDPFEHNLTQFRRVPNEGELFHSLIQDGNDLWNAAFFCGSCAVLRRRALEEIGGVAVETVTEDAHTALRLQRLGWGTALVNIPLAAGLATESLSAHVGQRIRWARGMAQIFRIDNPFLTRGLNWGQRLCYGSAMLHFFNGGPRLIFLTAPLAFLLFHCYVIHAAAIELLLYVLPHLVHASITNSRIQKRHRCSFWSDVYETVLAWYIVRPTSVALVNPHKGKFNVTVKGGVMPASRFDWRIAAPFLFLAALNALGLCAGIARIVWGPADEIGTTLINVGWVGFNLVFLGAAVAVAGDRVQRRQHQRALVDVTAMIRLPGGQRIKARTQDISSTGVALVVPLTSRLHVDDLVSVSLGRAKTTICARVVAIGDSMLRLEWMPLSRDQEVALVRSTFARHGAWTSWTLGRRPDQPLRSLREVILTGVHGYGQLARLALCSTPIQPIARGVERAWGWTASLLPCTPATPVALFELGQLRSAIEHDVLVPGVYR